MVEKGLGIKKKIILCAVEFNLEGNKACLKRLSPKQGSNFANNPYIKTKVMLLLGF